MLRFYARLVNRIAEPRYYEREWRIGIHAFTTVLLIIGVTILYHYGWLLSVLLVIGLIWLITYLVKRRRLLHIQRREALEETAEIGPYVTPREARQIQERRIHTDEEGLLRYVYNERKRYKRKFFSKARVRIVSHELLVEDSDIVDPKLIGRSRLTPSSTETIVRVADRLHWWSHGPQQILAVALALVSLIVAAYMLITTADPYVSNGVLAAELLILIASVVIYLSAWLPWAYTFIIVTNVRIIRIYRPPFGLPGTFEHAALEHILTVNVIDQQNGPRWIPSFGNWLPRFGIAGFKTLKADTAAQDDDWIRNEIRFLRNADDVEAVVAAIMSEHAALNEQRHVEDMGYQRRQAEATEDMRDRIGAFLEAVTPKT